MLHVRLSLALNEGRLPLAANQRILIIGPQRHHDLTMFSKDQVVIYSSYYPVYQLFDAQGYQVVNELPATGFDVAIICVPRSKQLALAWVHAANHATSQGLVVIDGQKTDGIDSLIKQVKKRTDGLSTIVKAHGKLAWFSGGDFQDWTLKQTSPSEEFVTVPGIFSPEKIDKGSQILAESSLDDLSGRVADFGAGWGFLSRKILENHKVTHLDLVEADFLALGAARKNILDERASFLWDDATKVRGAQPYDVVVSNPPFHETRAGDPEIGREFIRHAARVLTPAGRLIIVANRHLPYEQTLSECFQNVNNPDMIAGFKILRAQKPRRLSR